MPPRRKNSRRSLQTRHAADLFFSLWRSMVHVPTIKSAFSARNVTAISRFIGEYLFLSCIPVYDIPTRRRRLEDAPRKIDPTTPECLWYIAPINNTSRGSRPKSVMSANPPWAPDDLLLPMHFTCSVCLLIYSASIWGEAFALNIVQTVNN